MILPVGHDRIQDGCQIDPHGTLFRHFNIYNTPLNQFLMSELYEKNGIIRLSMIYTSKVMEKNVFASRA